MGYLYGQLRKWRRLLPLQLFGYKRVRQDRTRGHLRPRLPTHGRSPDVRRFPIAEEDEAHQDYQDVVQEVIALSFAVFSILSCSYNSLRVGIRGAHSCTK